MSLARSVTAVQLFLADGGNSPADIDPTTGHGPEWGKAAPMGLLVIVLLCVAVYFLVKSMNRNLKKVPESFDSAQKVSVAAGGQPVVEGGAAAAGTDADGVPPADTESGPSGRPAH